MPILCAPAQKKYSSLARKNSGLPISSLHGQHENNGLQRKKRRFIAGMSIANELIRIVIEMRFYKSSGGFLKKFP
jgi:hypothetical protein